MKKKARNLIVLLLTGIIACFVAGCETTTKELDDNDNAKLTVTEDRKQIEILSKKDCILELKVVISEDDIKTVGEKRIELRKGKKVTLKVEDFVEAEGFPESAIFSEITSAKIEERNLGIELIEVMVGLAIVILVVIVIVKEINENCKI